MDWKRLLQFALLGSRDLEPYAILLVRVSLGLFFAISGANKLFVAASRQTMRQTLVEAKVPFPHVMTYFVPLVEVVGGSLLAVGFLSSLACMALLVDMLVAILTTKLSAMPKVLSPFNWLDDFLYLPEVLYVLFFILLICSGPGKFSVDYRLAGELRSDRSTKQLVARELDGHYQNFSAPSLDASFTLELLFLSSSTRYAGSARVRNVSRPGRQPSGFELFT